MYGINDSRTGKSNSQSSTDYSLVIVDDDFYFRKGLINFLTEQNHHSKTRKLCLSVVGEADNKDQTLELNQKYKPDLVILDLDLGNQQLDGIGILRHLKQQTHQPQVLMLSASRHDREIYKAMSAGASGYLIKEQITSQLLEAIVTVTEGKIYLPPEVATSFFSFFHHKSTQPQTTNTSFEFTHREKEVLALLVEGKSNQKIAEQLFITIATVKAHLTSIFGKLQVSNRSQAIVKALHLQLIPQVKVMQNL